MSLQSTISLSRALPQTIWLDRGTIVAAANKNKTGVLFDKLQKCGFKTVHFECNNAGYALFQSELAELSPLLQGRDALAMALQEAHAREMKMHAWFWVFAAGNTKYNELVRCPIDFEGPVLKRLGMDAALRNASGSPLQAGQTEFWLSPASMLAREYALNLIVDVVDRYPVDGVHLDYIRFPFQKDGQEMGYDSVSQQRFQRDTGISMSARAGAGERKIWMEWKTELVNSFVCELSTVVRKLRAGIEISAAVFAMSRSDRVRTIQQDWETWVENQWVDILNPMTYDSMTLQFEGSVKTMAKACSGKRVQVCPGLAIARLDEPRFRKHLSLLHKHGFDSASIFAAAHVEGARLAWFTDSPV